MNRNDVKALLHERVIPIQFFKADNSIRVMQATLKESLLPSRNSDGTSEKPRKRNDDVQAVYDVDAEAWRSFKWNQLFLVNGKGYHDSNN